MTGTAETEAAEFQSTYKLGVVAIPTNRDMQRIDQRGPRLQERGRQVRRRRRGHRRAARARASRSWWAPPASRRASYLVQAAGQAGRPHEVLNAKQHAREASIVAQAGRKGAVTVATNMAGRGTDIMLGGNAEFMAVAELAKRGPGPGREPEEYEAAWPDGARVGQGGRRGRSTTRSSSLGGLYVLGTERHESRRIDNQLRGRSGRQGDPGESRFYLSMQTT